MQYLYVNYEAMVTGDRESDGATTDLTVVGIHLRGDFAVTEQIEVAFKPSLGQMVYLVVVRYEDGDTFGRDHGKYTFCAIFDTAEEATALEKFISANEESDINGIIPGIKTPMHIYAPWTGYFARFTCVEIHNLSIS